MLIPGEDDLKSYDFKFKSSDNEDILDKIANDIKVLKRIQKK